MALQEMEAERNDLHQMEQLLDGYCELSDVKRCLQHLIHMMRLHVEDSIRIERGG